MIEQTKLPNELIFVEYNDFNQVANVIKTLMVRDAPAIVGLKILQLVLFYFYNIIGLFDIQ